MEILIFDVQLSYRIISISGHLDIETILSNIENKARAEKGLLKKVGGARGSVSAGLRKADRECANPGCPKRGEHRCSRCLAVAFCSRDCSVLAWPQHQEICKPTRRVKINSLSEVD